MKVAMRMTRVEWEALAHPSEYVVGDRVRIWAGEGREVATGEVEEIVETPTGRIYGLAATYADGPIRPVSKSSEALSPA